MKAETRRKLEAMYQEYTQKRTDGGLDLTLDDHIHCALQAAKLGATPSEIANALGVPIHYVTALHDAIAEKSYLREGSPANLQR